jgi:hypothetical protein
MARFMRAIHVLFCFGRVQKGKHVDGPDKPGHDDEAEVQRNRHAARVFAL